MIKRLLACVKEYKKPTILTFIFLVGEVIIECLIPFITADLVNRLKAGIEIKALLITGLSLIAMAFVSLLCGGIAGYTSAKASAGFAKNIRNALFDRVQGYSFENIDKFSSTSLVTRLTTDVVNVQMSYMMIIRTAVRAPLMLIFSIIMAAYMGGKVLAVICSVLGISASEVNVEGFELEKYSADNIGF
jgi:ATP-binding cassette subfamily B protein